MLSPCATAQQTESSPQSLVKTLNTDPSESKRMEALISLQSRGALDAQQIARSICDTAPGIRAAALHAGEPLAHTDAELALRLIALHHDHSPEVQLELLNSLPKLSQPDAAIALHKLAQRLLNSPNPILRSAAEVVERPPKPLPQPTP
jgi:hypothetical protein